MLSKARLVANFLAITCSIAAVAFYMVSTAQWPVVGDAPLLNYVLFLHQHGLAFYRNILDPNLPGALAAQWTATLLFGSGQFGWRAYDLSLVAAVGIATARLTRPWGLTPALLATAVFAGLHGRDGMINTGQRDLLLAAFEIAGLATIAPLLEQAPQSRTAFRRLFAAGLLLGIGCTVKPTGFFLLLPLSCWFLLRKLRTGNTRQAWTDAATLLGSASLPLAGMLLALISSGALSAFWSTMTQLAPYHAHLWRRPLGDLLLTCLPAPLRPALLLWVPIFVIERRWREPRQALLLMAVCAGIASYMLQGRGYPYHRYPASAALAILLAVAFSTTNAFKRPGPVTRLPLLRIAGLLFLSLWVLGRSAWLVAGIHPRDAFDDHLRASLRSLGEETLNHQVQCLDMASGCVTTLHDERITQATGFLYDCYLYPLPMPTDAASLRERTRYRAAFQNSLEQQLPTLLLVSEDACGTPDTPYSKLDRWPWLSALVHDRYTLISEWKPTEAQSWGGGRPALPFGFRIYKLRMRMR